MTKYCYENIESILRKINIMYKKIIHFGANGTNCYSEKFVLDHNFNCLFCDSNKEKMHIAMEYYKAHKKLNLVTFVNGLITPDNVLTILDAMPKFKNNIDLLIITLKGNDYWILKKILDVNIIKPRIIMIEYIKIMGPEYSIAVPYDIDFDSREYNTNYYGASLKAYVKLLKEYNYDFIGYNIIDSYGFFLNKIESAINNINIIENLEECFDARQSIDLKLRHFYWVNV